MSQSTAENLANFVNRMNADVLDRRDFERVVRKIIEMLKKREAKQEDLLKKAVTALERMVQEKTRLSQSEMKKAVEKAVNDLKDQSSKVMRDQENSLNFIKDKVASYEDKRIDDELRLMSELEEKLKGIKIPEQFNPSSLVEQINILTKKTEEQDREIERLRKQKGRVGGGVTDIGVQASAGRSIVTETPSGLINGSNTDYTLTRSPNAILSFHINGQAIPSADYSIAGKTITFSTALPSALSGTEFEIVYI